MPPQRTALGAIFYNSARGKNPIPYMRGKIIGMTNTGALMAEIQAQYGLSRKAVRDSII